MKKLKILIRLTMIIFMFSLPIYQINILRNQYTEEKKLSVQRKERLSDEVEKTFLVRKEDFYKDSEYQRELKRLQIEKNIF